MAPAKVSTVCFLTVTWFGVIEDTKSFGVGEIATVFSCSCNRALCLKTLPSSFGPLAVKTKAISFVIEATILVVELGNTITSPAFNSWVNLLLTPWTTLSAVASPAKST